jgi:alpha-1,4-digalacturonate transport system substrate-binding protein
MPYATEYSAEPTPSRAPAVTPSVIGGLLFASVLTALCLPAAASAADIRVMCYQDGNECEVYKDLAGRFMKDHPDVHVTVDIVPYSAIMQSLPVQLAAGNGPDIARVTDFGATGKYLLDLRSYLPDAQLWETEFGQALNWMRPDPKNNAIYGLQSQLTVTGPIVNKTLFEQANIPVPGSKATWDDWASAVDKVAKATNTPYGMAWDRSGHRFAGPAISYGAKYFDANGQPAVIDPGFQAIAGRFVQWNNNGTVEKDIWAAEGGSGYKDAFSAFADGQIVLYLSGSWQIHRLDTQIGNAFEWEAVAQPCGPAACTGMPGGAALVGFKQTKSPKEVAAFLDYLAQPAVYKEMMERTDFIPAEKSLLKQNLTYQGLSPAGQAAIKTFLGNAETLVPLAYQLQGYRYNRVIFDATVARLSQAIVGQLTLDQAYARITDDIKQAMSAMGQ